MSKLCWSLIDYTLTTYCYARTPDSDEEEEAKSSEEEGDAMDIDNLVPEKKQSRIRKRG